MNLRPALALPVLVGAEVVAVTALHRLGGVDALALPGDVGWLGAAPPEDAIMVALRLVALCCAWWLLVTTVVYVLAQVSGRRVLVLAVRRVTLPAVRRSADRAIAVALSTSTVLGGGIATAAMAPAEPPYVVASADDLANAPLPEWFPRPGDPAWEDEAPPGPAPVVAPAEEDASWPAGLGAPDDVVDRDEPFTTWTVRPGENLWSIARAHLVASRGVHAQSPTDREVHAVWVEVLRRNDGRLTSGSFDLIFPGEEIALPVL